MARQVIILENTNMSQMTVAEQEEAWQLSHNYDIFERDANGVLWQILDLCPKKEVRSAEVLGPARKDH